MNPAPVQQPRRGMEEPAPNTNPQRPCSYCSRASHRGVVGVGRIQQGRLVRRVRFICPDCEISLLDAVLRPRADPLLASLNDDLQGGTS
jgi:hypothetical protein